ncbi:MAG TPA: glucoamylase family protein [Chitinophagales bacterium]|nr:glucoamylase family protein [Chitinophagales bacterium]
MQRINRPFIYLADAFLLLLFPILFFSAAPYQQQPQVVSATFMDSLSENTFHFFWDLAGEKNGQIPDRWPSESFSSIAATGFGLTAYIVGVERKYVSRQQAAERVLKTLKFFKNAKMGSEEKGITGYRGFFYHFIDMVTGLRFEKVELSTIDTGLLMAGILSCQTYFDADNATEKQIREIADQLYRNVEWDWAMNNEETMSMGWHPEKGFLDARWKGYNEAMILYVLALGSPTHTIPAESWNGWTKTYQWGTYYGQEMVNFGPLFGHQYSHMYIDFKGITDDYMRKKGIDYFENSRRATYANQSYCINNPAGYVGYDSTTWGLTACDGPGNDNKINPNIAFMGYSARGAAQWYVQDDGTIAPTAAGGSVPFAPEICLPALKSMKLQYGNKIYDRFGFRDAFNRTIINKDGTQGWVDPDYLGIDEGPIIIQLENYRTGLIWELMKKNPYIVAGLKKAGFSGGWIDKAK